MRIAVALVVAAAFVACGGKQSQDPPLTTITASTYVGDGDTDASACVIPSSFEKNDGGSIPQGTCETIDNFFLNSQAVCNATSYALSCENVEHVDPSLNCSVIAVPGAVGFGYYCCPCGD